MNLQKAPVNGNVFKSLIWKRRFLQALKHDLNLDEIGIASDPESALRRLQASVDLVSLEESLEIARAEAARASLEMQEQSRIIGSNFSDAVVCTVIVRCVLQMILRPREFGWILCFNQKKHFWIGSE